MNQNNQNAPASAGSSVAKREPYAPGPHGLGTPTPAPVVKPSDNKKKAPKKPAPAAGHLRRVEDSAFYPPAFVEVLAAKLAARMAERIIGASGKRELAWKEYEAALKQAKRLNAIQLPPQRPADGDWLRAHMTGGSW